jgi:hypothetical protein
MSEQFHVFFNTDKDAADAYALLRTLHVNGKPALHMEEQGGAAVFAGCGIFEAIPRDASLSVGDTGRSAPFFDIFYQIDAMKSGMHHPDGLLWIRRPDRSHRVHPEKVPLTSVAPTILHLLDLHRPAHVGGMSLFQEATRRADRADRDAQAVEELAAAGVP